MQSTIDQTFTIAEEEEHAHEVMTGQLCRWLNGCLPIALDKSMWNYHIDKLKYPNRDISQPHSHNANATTQSPLVVRSIQ